MYEKILKVKRTRFYLLETVLGLCILLALNIIFLPNKPAFEGINPNPLWIVILAIAARYGRSGALFASVMTALLFLGYYAFVYSYSVFLDDLWLLRFPFLFLIVGFLIGEIKTVFILTEDYLLARVGELENLNDKLKKENDIIKEAHRDLSADVATNQDTLTILSEITSRLKSDDPQHIYKGILDNFRDYLAVEECSFYILEGNLLTLKHSNGWKDYYRRPEVYEMGKGLIGISAKEKRPISVKDIVLKRHPAHIEGLDMMGDSILAVPVLGLEDQVYGVASIEKIPLLKMTDSTIQTTKIICELAASSLSNAFAFKTLEAKQMKHEEYNLYRYDFFLKRIEEEFLHSLNYMLPLSIMAFKWHKLSSISTEKQIALMESIVKLIQLNLRAFDVLAKGPIKDVPLILLLATTSGPQANGFKQKIIDKIGEYNFAPLLSDRPIQETIEVVDFNPNKIKSSTDMLNLLGL